MNKDPHFLHGPVLVDTWHGPCDEIRWGSVGRGGISVSQHLEEVGGLQNGEEQARCTMESVNSTKRRTGDLKGSARGKKGSNGGTGALKEDLHRGGRLAIRCGTGVRARAPCRLAFT